MLLGSEMDELAGLLVAGQADGLAHYLDGLSAEQRQRVLNEGREKDGMTAACFYAECCESNDEIISVLAKRGADFAKPKANQFTPLMLACSTEGRAENAKQILKLCDQKGIEIGLMAVEKTDECTALHHAVMSCNEEVLPHLVAAHVSCGETLDPVTLHPPSKSGSSLLKGASDGGETPLHLAVRYSAQRLCEMLKDAGADHTVKNGAGLTACRLAAKTCNPDALELLLPCERDADAIEAMYTDAQRTHQLIVHSLKEHDSLGGDPISPKLREWSQQRYWEASKTDVRRWLKESLGTLSQLSARLAAEKRATPPALPLLPLSFRDKPQPRQATGSPRGEGTRGSVGGIVRAARGGPAPHEKWEMALETGASSQTLKAAAVVGAVLGRPGQRAARSDSSPHEKWLVKLEAAQAVGRHDATSPSKAIDVLSSKHNALFSSSSRLQSSSGVVMASRPWTNNGVVNRMVPPWKDPPSRREAPASSKRHFSSQALPRGTDQGKTSQTLSSTRRSRLSLPKGDKTPASPLPKTSSPPSEPPLQDENSAENQRSAKGESEGAGGKEQLSAGGVERGRNAGRVANDARDDERDDATNDHAGHHDWVSDSESGSVCADAAAESGSVCADAAANEAPYSTQGSAGTAIPKTEASSAAVHATQESAFEAERGGAKMAASGGGGDMGRIEMRASEDEEEATHGSVSVVTDSQGSIDDKMSGDICEIPDSQENDDAMDVGGVDAGVAEERGAKDKVGSSEKGGGDDMHEGNVSKGMGLSGMSLSSTLAKAASSFFFGLSTSLADPPSSRVTSIPSGAPAELPVCQRQPPASLAEVMVPEEDTEGRINARKVHDLIRNHESMGLLNLLTKLGMVAGKEALNTFVGHDSAASVFARHAEEGKGCAALLLLLTGAGANFGQRISKKHESPLMIACNRISKGAGEGRFVARAILELKCDIAIMAKRADGWTALHLAIVGHDEDLCRLIVTRGGRWDSKDSRGYTSAHLGCKLCVKPSLRDFLLTTCGLLTKGKLADMVYLAEATITFLRRGLDFEGEFSSWMAINKETLCIIVLGIQEEKLDCSTIEKLKSWVEDGKSLLECLARLQIDAPVKGLTRHAKDKDKDGNLISLKRLVEQKREECNILQANDSAQLLIKSAKEGYVCASQSSLFSDASGLGEDLSSLCQALSGVSPVLSGREAGQSSLSESRAHKIHVEDCNRTGKRAIEGSEGAEHVKGKAPIEKKHKANLEVGEVPRWVRDAAKLEVPIISMDAFFGMIERSPMPSQGEQKGGFSQETGAGIGAGMHAVQTPKTRMSSFPKVSKGLNGLTFAFCGKFGEGDEFVDHQELRDLVSRLGGTHHGWVVSDLNYMVRGETLTETARKKSEKFGIPIIDAGEFFDLVDRRLQSDKAKCDKVEAKTSAKSKARPSRFQGFCSMAFESTEKECSCPITLPSDQGSKGRQARSSGASDRDGCSSDGGVKERYEQTCVRKRKVSEECSEGLHDGKRVFSEMRKSENGGLVCIGRASSGVQFGESSRNGTPVKEWDIQCKKSSCKSKQHSKRDEFRDLSPPRRERLVPPRQLSPTPSKHSSAPVQLTQEVVQRVRMVRQLIRDMDDMRLRALLRPLSHEQRCECLNNWSVTGQTAFGVYAAFGRPSPGLAPCPLFELLVDMGADPAIRDDEGHTALILACMRTDLAGAGKGVQAKVLNLLLELHDCGTDISIDATEKKDACTALLAAMASGDESRQASSILIKRRINIDSRCYPRNVPGSTLWGTCDDGETPLMMSVRMEDFFSLERLLAAGADVNQQSDKGMTALHIAALLGNSTAMEILLHDRHIELSARMLRYMLPLAEGTLAEITTSESCVAKTKKMTTALLDRTLMYHWHPKDIKDFLKWKETTNECMKMIKERIRVLDKEEKELISLAGGPGQVAKIVTLNELCEMIGALPMRETQLSAAANNVYCKRFHLKLTPKNKKKSWLGMIRLPDMNVCRGDEVREADRSVRWPSKYNETEVLDPSDGTGSTTIITRTLVECEPAVKKAILEYNRHSSRHPGLKIGLLGPDHPAYLGETSPSFCLLAAERIYQGVIICEYVGKVQTKVELEAMDESLALHHEFGIDATNNWGGGAPLLITSNTGNDIPVRSTAMLINDPRKGLDGGLCKECTEVEVDTSLEEIARTGKLRVKSISDMFGPPSHDEGRNQILFPIAIGKDGEYISDLKVIGLDREKNDILVSDDFLKRVHKSTRKKVIPEGTDVIQHANCYFQEAEVDGFPRVFVRTESVIEKGEELLAHYGSTFWSVNQQVIMQQKLQEERFKRERAERELLERNLREDALRKEIEELKRRLSHS